MENPFTEEQLEIMSGKYASLAKKHGVSTSYVQQIAFGQRETNTALAKKILADITATINFFTPKVTQTENQ